MNFDEQVSAAMAELGQARVLMEAVQQATTQREVTVRSHNRALSVTVDAQGMLTGLQFHGDAYRKLPPAELSQLVVDTFGQARDEAQNDMMDVLRGAMGPDFAMDLDDLLDDSAAEELVTRTLLDPRSGVTAADVETFEQMKREAR